DAEIKHAVASGNDQWLAVVTADDKLHIHDRGSLREVQTIALTQPVTAIQLSPDGKRVAVVGERAFAKVYASASGNEIVSLKGHEGTVFTVAFSPDGRTVVTGGDDRT